MNTLKISVRRHISVESCVIYHTPIGCGLGRDHLELDLVEVQFIPVSPNNIPSYRTIMFQDGFRVDGGKLINVQVELTVRIAINCTIPYVAH